ncbi:MAG: tetratricopeptide repeat protein [Deltaproteobacteria bacterium]|nr:tetratricopeptide repeat protein [Deltaproteobacteria bacterium]
MTDYANHKSSSETTPSTRKEVISGKTLALIMLLFVVGFLIYSEVMKGPFLYDDEPYIVTNALIYRLDNFFVLPFNRYVTFLSFAVNYALTGLIPFDFRMVNVLIHIVNSVLVYAFTIQIFRTPRMSGHGRTPTNGNAYAIAAMAALIFVSHPIQTQAVSYITQRFASLATLFYLLSIVSYLDYRLHEQQAPQWRRIPPYCLSLFFAVVAQFTKEISFTLPAVVLLIEAVFFDARDEAGGFKKRIWRLAPFLAVFLVLPFVFLASPLLGISHDGVAESIRRAQVEELQNLSSQDYLITQFRVIVEYLRLLVWPAGLRLYYEFPAYKSFFEPTILLSFIFLALIFSLGAYLCFARRGSDKTLAPFIGFGILWFFITVSVESSIIPIRHVIFEHRLYLPSVGAILAASGFLYQLFVFLWRGQERISRAWWTLAAVITLALSITAYNRNIVWVDRLVFWNDVVAKAPQTSNAYVNLGSAYANKAMYVNALESYEKGLKLDPSHAGAYAGMGEAYAMIGRLDEARDACLKAIKMAPNLIGAYQNLGMVLYLRKDYEAAIINFRKALAIAPSSVGITKNLAATLETLGRFDEAISLYENLLKKMPRRSDVYFDIGGLLVKSGRVKEAGAYYKEAVRLELRYASLVPDNLR